MGTRKTWWVVVTAQRGRILVPAAFHRRSIFPNSQFLGFDACAHVAEETRYSDINAPRGMVGSAVATAVGSTAGFHAVLLSVRSCCLVLLLLTKDCWSLCKHSSLGFGACAHVAEEIRPT